MKSKSLFFFLLILIATTTKAQWQHANGPYFQGVGLPASVNAFMNNGTRTFAASTLGVHATDDYGGNWTGVGWDLGYYNTLSLAKISNILFAGTRYGGVYKSVNNGANWTPDNNGISLSD